MASDTPEHEDVGSSPTVIVGPGGTFHNGNIVMYPSTTGGGDAEEHLSITQSKSLEERVAQLEADGRRRDDKDQSLTDAIFGGEATIQDLREKYCAQILEEAPSVRGGESPPPPTPQGKTAAAKAILEKYMRRPRVPEGSSGSTS